MENQKRFKFKWFPRILSIVFILFLSLFATDVFLMEGPLFQKIAGFLIHLIPSFCLLFFLLVAWRKPKEGGYLFLILSIIFTLRFQTYKNIYSFLLISLPLLIVGICFLIENRLDQKS